MGYRILLHPDVEQDIEDIFYLIADYSGVDVALRKTNEIRNRILELSNVPNVGSIRDDILENLRAIPVIKKGVITFLVDNESEEVLILSISYAGRDWLSMAKIR